MTGAKVLYFSQSAGWHCSERYTKSGFYVTILGGFAPKEGRFTTALKELGGLAPKKRRILPLFCHFCHQITRFLGGYAPKYEHSFWVVLLRNMQSGFVSLQITEIKVSSSFLMIAASSTQEVTY